MLTVKCLSNKPCFICAKAEQTVEVVFLDKSFRGVLCLTHIYEKLKHQAQEQANVPTVRRV